MRIRTVTPAHWRPVAYLVVGDPACRGRIAEVLHRQGWSVIESPTGFHLVHSLSGVILGDAPWLRPSLIVADATARGCSGASIAAGLRDLGIAIPIVLLGDRDVDIDERDVVRTRTEDAARVVAEIARPWSPAKHLVDVVHERAIA